jgi:hypothetical protein
MRRVPQSCSGVIMKLESVRIEIKRGTVGHRLVEYVFETTNEIEE